MRLHTIPDETYAQPAISSTDRAGILEQALRLASAGRLDDAKRSHLWALVAGGAIQGETAQALVEIDTAARKSADECPLRGDKPLAERRKIWRNLTAELPSASRFVFELKLPQEAVLAILLTRVEFTGGEWRSQISMTELERLLGGASRRTVREAVKVIERQGAVGVIRRRRNQRFCEVNVYVLAHPVLVEAAEKRAEKRAARRADSNRVLSPPGNCKASTAARQNTNRARKAAACRDLQRERKPAATPNSLPSVKPSAKNRTTASPREPGLAAEVIQALILRLVRNPETVTDVDHWRLAESLLATDLVKFDRRIWRYARFHHGNRAALAVIETVLVARHRAGTADRVRSLPAYLGGILRRERQDCRPEVTLERLAANTNVRLDMPLALTG